MAQRIALIGYGAIGASVHRLLAEQPPGQVEVVAILVRDGARVAREFPASAPLLVDSLDALMQHRPALVVECAGHEAVDAHAASVLRAGCDLVLVSIGALADAAREQSLMAAAHAARTRLILPPGAIGGVDWLAAARTAGLTRVVYRSRKPPHAWAGSPAEKLLQLDSLTEAATFFRGSARDAALQYPRNANVAATVALATLGFDRTDVEMIADPAAPGNVHEIEAEGEGGSLFTRIVGRADPRNPRTSVMTAHSVVRAVLNQSATVVI